MERLRSSGPAVQALLSGFWAGLSLLVEGGLLHPIPSASSEANANTKARDFMVFSPKEQIIRE
jgi:hypothetical protein